jgi:hypothetical protein
MRRAGGGWAIGMALMLAILSGCGGTTADPATATPDSAGELTVGDLADRIAVAWEGIASYRSVFTTQALGSPPAATPSAGAVEVVTEVIVPDRKRQVTWTDGEITAEVIVVNTTIHARGTLATFLAPSTPVAGDWVTVDAGAVNPASQTGALIGSLLQPVRPPYVELSEAERTRIATPLGERTIGDRACTAYQIADTTATGERLEVVLAIDAGDLPCAIETRAASSLNLTTFTFNLPLTIEPPG